MHGFSFACRGDVGWVEVPRESTGNNVGDMPRVYLSHNLFSRKGIAMKMYTKVHAVRMCDMNMAILRHDSAWFLGTSRLCTSRQTQ